jgi:homocysteine S-methyltransferase
VPVLLGLMPLHSLRHAEFIHNELVGVDVPESVRDRMREAGDDALKEGLAIARETVAAARGAVQGVYLIPSFGRYDVSAELIEEVKAGS